MSFRKVQGFRTCVLALRKGVFSAASRAAELRAATWRDRGVRSDKRMTDGTRCGCSAVRTNCLQSMSLFLMSYLLYCCAHLLWSCWGRRQGWECPALEAQLVGVTWYYVTRVARFAREWSWATFPALSSFFIEDISKSGYASWPKPLNCLANLSFASLDWPFIPLWLVDFGFSLREY